MTHTGQEFRLRLAGDVVLLLVHLALDYPAQLRQALVPLRVKGLFLPKAQDTDVPHIASIVVHGQRHAVLPGRHAQEALQKLPAAVLPGEPLYLLLAQPAAEGLPVLFPVFSPSARHWYSR